MAGAVSTVTASLNNLTHGSAGDLDVLLVAPNGSNLILMSDPGDGTSFSFANNATLTFSDAAGSSLPASGSIATGTYKPTNENPGGSPDSFPAPAPAPSSNTTLSSAFTGVSPNGQWKLYVVDDVSGDAGTIAWRLEPDGHHHGRRRRDHDDALGVAQPGHRRADRHADCVGHRRPGAR